MSPRGESRVHFHAEDLMMNLSRMFWSNWGWERRTRPLRLRTDWRRAARICGCSSAVALLVTATACSENSHSNQKAGAAESTSPPPELSAATAARVAAPSSSADAEYA